MEMSPVNQTLNTTTTDRDTDVEAQLWQALDLATLGKEMKSGKFAPSNHVVMGTTRSDNNCGQCGNSHTTSGCGGC